jgi:hypothetical protein
MKITINQLRRIMGAQSLHDEDSFVNDIQDI